ncbi:MAG: hypothetical protein B6D78_17760 [gamma proteobacterium symbiont of Ctena orbiculata]|nr:MAG: hypothetical protein B6D78_17760 [gamma proteobacterium symbiont of Ctena orbiculata]PVV24543.1 MAG: hypothetical protein B6D79_10810 [gamma proteobacterium symbiont of Ctena orbiculata]
MIKRWLIQLGQWLFVDYKKQQKPNLKASDEPNPTRRRFFKQAAIGAVSVTGTAGLAKTVVDGVPTPDLKQKYRRDALQGEAELREWEYVVMTDLEKKDMVQSLINNYDHKT